MSYKPFKKKTSKPCCSRKISQSLKGVNKQLSEKNCRDALKEKTVNKMRVAIYARVSTERQEKEQTIDSQIEQLEAVC